MRKNAKMLSLSGVIVTAVVLALFFTLPTAVAAKSKTVAIEGMSYDVDSSMADNLKGLFGKRVSVTVTSGKTFIGFVKEVGDHLVHLEKLEGQDYFDALIRIENISAIDAMFRTYQRQ
jgi:small nuclear ribonucleoprotein (snRNP)-like protein